MLYEGTAVCFLLLVCGSYFPEAVCYGALWWGRCSLGPQWLCWVTPELLGSAVILNVCLSQETQCDQSAITDPSARAFSLRALWRYRHHLLTSPCGLFGDTSITCWLFVFLFSFRFHLLWVKFLSSFTVFHPNNLDTWNLIFFSKFKILLCVGESLLLIHITQINHFYCDINILWWILFVLPFFDIHILFLTCGYYRTQ